MKRSIVAFLLIAVFGSGCDVQVHQLTTTPAVSVLITSTLPAPLAQVPSETPLPPPPPPTAPPVEGVTSTQINVRAEPSTAGNVLGTIPANTRLEIVGKDPGENWWQINYPQGQGVDGKGWVSAQYVTTAARPEVPTIGGAATGASSGNVAIVQQQINVRSGPGTGFNSLGTLNPQDVLSLTGKDPNGAWLQIEFAAGPGGKGWVNAAFVRAQGVENLPIVTEAGLVVGTGTPTVVPSTPTTTVVPAQADNDSPDAPMVSVVFEPGGTQAFTYNGEVSTPEGDMEDWIAFRPYSSRVLVSLECHGGNVLKVETAENSFPIAAYINCSDTMKPVVVDPGSNYLLHIRALPSAGGLQYINYILTIKTRP
jgi:uncharacterized protein YraI